MKTKTLFATYGSVIASFKDVKDRQNLLLEDFGEERIYYAPFDYVNPKARLFIVGITPGEVQMNNMLVEAARLIHQGFSDEFENRLLPELPHPSRANGERIAYFLGQKAKEKLSRLTDPEKLDNSKKNMKKILKSLKVKGSK